MATPIKITPVLQGKASKYFNKSLERQAAQKISDEAKKKMYALVEKVLAKSNLPK